MSHTPPIAPRDPIATTFHGDTRTDEYAWLSDRDDPRVRAYLDAENAYAEARLPAELREALSLEILSHVQETDVSAPVRRDDYVYFTRTYQGLQYPNHCRRRDGGDEEVILDRNVLAEDHPFHSLGVFAVSDDHGLLAYSEDVSGDESYALRVKDLATGELLPDTVDGTYYSFAWANDAHSFLYTVHDASMRPYAVRRHVLGADASDDVEVFTEPDDRFHVVVHKARGRRYVFVRSSSAVTTGVHLTDDAASLSGPWRAFAERRQGIEYDVEHQGDRFLIRTNEDALNFRLFEADVDDHDRARWREIVPHRADVKLEGMDAFRDHLVLYERYEGLRHIRVLSEDGDETLDLPEPVWALWPGPNPTDDTTTRSEHVAAAEDPSC